MTKDEFVAMATAAAREGCRATPPGIAVAQAALESNWGESRLSREGHNYFGIKAHGKHGVIDLPTVEVERGAEKRVRAGFAAYGSMRECFECREQLILRGTAYSESRATARQPEAFARALAKKWATDPLYAEKLLRVYRQNGFDRLDEERTKK